MPLIERMFRYTYILATNMLDEMIDHAQFDKIDTLVTGARFAGSSPRFALGLTMPASSHARLFGKKSNAPTTCNRSK